METFLLLNVPTVVLGIGIVVIAVALGVGGLALVRRNVALSTLESHVEVAGFILAVVGVVYAVLLGFVVVVVWQDFDATKASAEREAALVGSVYRDALVLGPAGGPARDAVRGYAQSVVQAEWPSLHTAHRESRRTDVALDGVWNAFHAIPPRAPGDSPFYSEAIGRLHELSELRRTRVFDSGNTLPPPLWTVLVAGALITVGFTYFFGIGSFRAHALMVAALSAMIGLALFLALSLDLPFTGAIGIRPTAMRAIIQEFGHYSG